MPRDVHEELLDRRTILLDTPITDDVANTVIAKLLFLAAENPTTPGHLWIDSLGGHLAATLAIRDTFDDVCPVHVKGLDNVGGVAVMLLAHGTRGKRTATSRTRVALAPVELTKIASVDDITRSQAILVEMLAADTGQSIDVIRRDMAARRSFTTAEALAYGFIDRIEDRIDAR
jgi:ATP-dependent Clp protease protease subunit